MKGTARFNLRLDKLLKDGKAPIELIYSVAGQRKYYNTGEKILPLYWDSSQQRCRYVPIREAKKQIANILFHSFPLESEIADANDNLEELLKTLENHERDLIRQKVPFSSEMIIDLLKIDKGVLVKQEEPKSFVYDYIQHYIDVNSSVRAKGSLSVYKALSVHLQDFETKTKTKVRFDKIDYNFFQAFQNFLISKTSFQKDGSVQHLQNTTIAKQLSTLKTFLGYASLQGIPIDRSLYDQFKIKRDPLEVIALTQDEFELLYSHDLKDNKRLDQVRDVFCFACVTGLRYSDLKQLRRNHITNETLTITVTKTKERLQIPLSHYSQEILNKYAEHALPIPVISSQNLNLYIKELCKLVGITQPIEIVRYRGAKREAIVYPKHDLIHIHTGRKTFVTLSLERGMSAEEVMAITGHTDYKSFARYVKITEKRKNVVMIKAWGAPAVSLKVV